MNTFKFSKIRKREWRHNHLQVVVEQVQTVPFWRELQVVPVVMDEVA
jgi:hypothetical protein